MMLLAAVGWGEAAALEPGDASRNFALKNDRGEIVTLSSVAKDADLTLLQILSVYCESCKKQIPVINDIFRQYRSRGVRIVTVALGNGIDEIASFSKQFNNPGVVLADPDNIVYYMYGVQKVPQYYLIDCWGTIRYRAGAQETALLQKELDLILQQQSTPLRAGDPARGFALPGKNGKICTVAFDRSSRSTIIAFFDDEDEVNRAQAEFLNRLVLFSDNHETRIVGIASPALSKAFERFAATVKPLFPFLQDHNGTVCASYGVTHAPEMVIVDESGLLRRRRYYNNYAPRLHPSGLPVTKGVTRALDEKTMKILRGALPGTASLKPSVLGKETIYISTDERGEKFYSRIVKRDILCDVCSDLHFLYSLDQEGIYRNIFLIDPLEYYGAPVDASDFISQFIGKSYHHTFYAGGNVDIISGATKSCLKIIDALNESEKLFSLYVGDPLFDAAFRRKICFIHQAEIEWAIYLYRREHDTPLHELDINSAASYCPGGRLPRCPSGGSYKMVILNNVPRVMSTIHGLDPESASLSLR